MVGTNYPGHSPKIQFDGKGGFIFNSSSYIDISGFEIEGPNQQITQSEAMADRLIHSDYFSGRGVTVWGSDPYPHHIKLHHMKVHDCPNSGLRINNGDYCEISHNEVYNNTWWSSNAESAIVLAQSKDFDIKDTIKMVMSHNVVYDNRNNIPFYNGTNPGGPTCYGEVCQDYIIDGSGVYITRNTEGSPGVAVGEGYTHGWFYFANNVTYGNGINGLVVHHTNKAIVTNNVAYMNGTVSPSTWSRQASSGITINEGDQVYVYNNISWPRLDTDYGYQKYGTVTNTTISNNILVGGLSAFNASEYTQYSRTSTEAINMFVDTAAKNFNIDSLSVLVDAGIDHANLPPFDIIGNARVGLPDIGAYEYQPQAMKEYTGCFGVDELGYFESASPLADFYVADEGNGTISVETSEVYEGTQSIKADVSVAGGWQVRMFNLGCKFDIEADQKYTAKVYVKGEVGDEFDLILMDDGTNMSTQRVTITSTEWTLYDAVVTSNATSTNGQLRVVFRDQGVYYIDNLTVEKGPEFVTIPLTDNKIYWEGITETEITGGGELRAFRFPKSYAITGASGYYSSANASSCAGAVLKFKTTSPYVNIDFAEDLTYAQDIFWHEIAIYKNGELINESNDFSFSLSNPTEELVEWRFVMPVYTQMNVTKLELVEGYNFETISEVKPVYLAIGNSITMGVGASNNNSNKTYSRLVADSLGYELYNWGIGGSKIYENILGNFSAGLQPDLITVLWGYNDVHYSGNDDYFNTNSFPQYETLIDSLCSMFPSAKVMAILPTYTTNPTNTAARTVPLMKAGQLSILETLVTEHSNLCYFDGETYTDAGSLNDAVHPNDHGNEDIARGIFENYEACGALPADCNGDAGGTATLDACNKCVGGNTGETSDDADGDGILDCNDTYPNDYDNDGVATSIDCDDNNIAVGAATFWYEDADGDNLGNSAVSQSSCTQPSGYVADNTDVNDDDQDNDGVITAEDCDDNNSAVGVATTWYQDTDNDGAGDPNQTLVSCTQPSDYVNVAGDECPSDINKTTPGACGCGATEGSCVDCNGVQGGSAYTDNCLVCVGGNTGKEACLQDCNNDWGGSAITDSCGVCSGGNTGVTAELNKDNCNPTSVSEISSEEIVVYPNPFSSTIIIVVLSVSDVQIYSLAGELIYENELIGEVSVGEGWPSGVYLLKIKSESTNRTVKLVKY